jgi:hypothetical protein
MLGNITQSGKRYEYEPGDHCVFVLITERAPTGYLGA